MSQKRKNCEEIPETSKRFKPFVRPEAEMKINIGNASTDFIVVQLEYDKEEHACNVLNRSAGFSKANLSWDFNKTEHGFQCSVKLHNQTFHSAEGKW